MNTEFCVVCGRTDRPVIDGECAECYAKHHPLVVPLPHPRVTLCPTCGARMVGSHWERRGASSVLSPEDLNPLVMFHPEVGVREVLWQESGRNPLLRELQGTFRLRFRDSEQQLEVPLAVQVVHRTCPECARRSGHYYTARIQLRGPEGHRGQLRPEVRLRMVALFDEVLADARSEWRQALSWREALPEGWDFYLTDTTAARSLGRFLKERLGGELKESASLYGRKDGREVYRTTLRVRVPGEALDARFHPARASGARRAAPEPAPRTARLRREQT